MLKKLREWMRGIRFQQSALCILLLAGLGAYFFLAWWLRVREFILSPENMDALYRVGTQLFLPYIGIAFGGIFGTARLSRRDVEPDVYVFVIAALSVVLWDLLALGNVFLITFEVHKVEDVVRFSETTMPLLSTLVAASIAYYFGAQSGGQTAAVSGGSRGGTT